MKEIDRVFIVFDRMLVLPVEIWYKVSEVRVFTCSCWVPM